MSKCPFCAQEVAVDARKCPHCHEWLVPGADKRSAESIREDQAELAERRTAEAVQGRVEQALIKRYSVIGFFVAALTGGTVTLLVKTNMDSALLASQQDLAVSKALQARSTKALDELDKSLTRMSHLEKKLEELSKTATGAEEKFRSLEILSVTIKRDQFSGSSDVLALVKQLESRIHAVTETVKSIGLNANQLARLEPSAVTDGPHKSIDRALDRAEKRQYLVEVERLPKATELVEALTKSGYNSRIYVESGNGNPDEFNAIFVGRDVPFRNAIEIIKIGISYFPQLRYIALSGDLSWNPRHLEMYLGGANTAALEEKLMPIPADKLAVLLDNVKSQVEFHDMIRRYRDKPAAATKRLR